MAQNPVRVSFRFSPLVLQDARILVKTRMYPDPLNPKYMLHFNSLQDYVNFIVRCCNQMSPTWWDIFCHAYNPDFPQEKEKRG